MARTGMDAFWVLMPPEFHYMGDLFLPDPPRARMAARIALETSRLRSRGHFVLFEAGMQGLTAPEWASLLKERGVGRAAAAGMRGDEKSALALCEELDRAGIASGRPLISENDGRDILPALSKRVESQARMDLAPPGSPPPAARGAETFMIIEEGEPLPESGAAFRRDGPVLIRSSPGRAPGVPPEVNRIRLVHSAREEVSKISGDELVALSLPLGGESGPDWLSSCDRLIRGAGPDRFRLWRAEPPRTPPPVAAGAQWALRYGLENESLREMLAALLREHHPHRSALLETLLGFLFLGVDPLEEMFAGRGLCERNAELIENIAP